FAACATSLWSGCESDLSSDVEHCGACNTPCPAIPNATAACSGATCVIQSCDPGFADCDLDPTNGCEVNLQIDVSNCGACANACQPVANGTPACVGFTCVIASCDPGFADCFGG